MLSTLLKKYAVLKINKNYLILKSKNFVPSFAFFGLKQVFIVFDPISGSLMVRVPAN